MATDWRRRWLDRANHLASWSKDPSTKVGCVLVLDQHAVGEGYNGFPHGVKDEEDRLLARASKLQWTIHAEANAVAHAARYGHSTRGATAFLTHPPCCFCATLLIQAGVVVVVIDTGPGIDDYLGRWSQDCDVARAILTEAGVAVIDHPQPENAPHAFVGSLVHPGCGVCHLPQDATIHLTEVPYVAPSPTSL